MDLNEVRKQAKNSGYKIGSLADHIGVNRSTLSRFINGKSKLGKYALEELILILETLKKKAS